MEEISGCLKIECKAEREQELLSIDSQMKEVLRRRGGGLLEMETSTNGFQRGFFIDFGSSELIQVSLPSHSKDRQPFAIVGQCGRQRAPLHSKNRERAPSATQYLDLFVLPSTVFKGSVACTCLAFLFLFSFP